MIRVLHFVSRMDRGGQETLIMNLYRNIDKKKIQFLFLCTSEKRGDYDDEIISMGGKLYHLPEQASDKMPPFNYCHTINVLKEWLADNKHLYDIVHLHTYHALDVLIHLEACRRAGVKKRIIHSHNTQGPHAILHFVCRYLCRLYNFKRFACGMNAGEWLFGKKDVIDGKVTIIKNGIITSNFKYNETISREYKDQLGIKGKTVLGHVGRFEPQKNHTFLIDVFEEFVKEKPNSVLLLIGRGSLENKIKDIVRQKKLEEKVLFLGIRNDVASLLSAMDFFVFPSLHEGLSVASIEVQCNGLPMLTSSIPSMIESDVSNLITFESLQSDAYSWSKILTSMNGRSNQVNYHEIIKNAGYDIVDSAKRIETEYIQYIEGE